MSIPINKEQQKQALLTALQNNNQDYIKYMAETKKFLRPEYTINAQRRPLPCKLCAFIHQNQMCLLNNWYITPDMTACNGWLNLTHWMEKNNG